MQSLQCAAGVVEPALGVVAELGRWFVGAAILPLSGIFQLRRRNWATTVHRALPMCGWPALGMPWGTAKWNAGSAVCSRCGGACAWSCGRTGQVVVCGGCSFAAFWSFLVMEAQPGNHSAQSPASVCVVSPGYDIELCKVECSLCGVQQLWWRLHWVLRQGWTAGAMLGVRFCLYWGGFQLWRRRSATTVHRALPVCV